MAEGYAKISRRDRSVEFESDFVPIVPFGDKAKIIRIIDGNESHCFEGKVYLSTHALLRIVDVNDNLLADTELEALQSVSLNAKACPVRPNDKYQRLFGAEHLPKYDVQVFSISLTKLRFVSVEQFEVGACLQIMLPDPFVIRRMTVRVSQQLQFGGIKTGHRCEILDLTEAERNKLADYLIQNQQIFDDESQDEDPYFPTKL